MTHVNVSALVDDLVMLGFTKRPGTVLRPNYDALCEAWAELSAIEKRDIAAAWPRKILEATSRAPDPVPIRLICPSCGELHIDVGEFETKPHHTHACQNCGNVWRPAVATTVGVRFLPGFKNEPTDDGPGTDDV